MDTDETREISRIVEQIRPLLAGKPAELQGAVLGDCLALWLAGHQVPGDEEATATLRTDLLAFHLSMVGALTIINAKMLGTESGAPRLPGISQ